MRIGVAIAGLLTLAATAHADPYPTVHLAARIAAQHTKVGKDDGAPDGWGARYEISAGVRPTELISFWGVAALSSYSDSQLSDPIAGRTYSLAVKDEWLGLRFLLHPHRIVFVGAGYTKIYTTETSDTGSQSFDNTSWEFIGGANLLETRTVTVQATLSYGYYERFHGLEYVQFWTIGGGLQF